MRTKETPCLYRHQLQALEFIQDKDHFALFCEQGTGKSKVIVEKAFDLWGKGLIDCVIVVAPNAVKPQWTNEQFPEHFPSNDWIEYTWYGAGTKRAQKEFHDKLNTMDKLLVFSINVESLQSEGIDLYLKSVIRTRKCFMVIDESTRIKNGRRKPVKGRRAGAKRTNKLLDLSHEIPYRAILTGTPTPKGPFDLWSQFEFLRRDFFEMDYFFFTHHYGIMIKKSTQEGKSYSTILDEKTYNLIKHFLKNKEISPRLVEEASIVFNMSTRDVFVINKMTEYSGYKNLKELRDKLATTTFFVKKKDCLDLPDKVYEKLYCSMGKVQSLLYKEMKEKMFSEYGGEELTVTNKMVLALRLQMITGGLFPYSKMDIVVGPNDEEFFETSYEYKPIEDNGKISVLLEDLEEVSEETSIIVWARFRGEIDLITTALQEAGYSVGKYYGGSSDDVIEKFKRKEIRFLIANPVKGGEGLNLQVSTLHYFYSNSWKADSREQAEDRSHRIGQTNKVTYKDLIVPKTIDERILEVLIRKGKLIDYFRSGGRVE